MGFGVGLAVGCRCGGSESEVAGCFQLEVGEEHSTTATTMTAGVLHYFVTGKEAGSLG